MLAKKIIGGESLWLPDCLLSLGEPDSMTFDRRTFLSAAGCVLTAAALPSTAAAQGVHLAARRPRRKRLRDGHGQSPRPRPVRRDDLRRRTAPLADAAASGHAGHGATSRRPSTDRQPGGAIPRHRPADRGREGGTRSATTRGPIPSSTAAPTSAVNPRDRRHDRSDLFDITGRPARHLSPRPYGAFTNSQAGDAARARGACRRSCGRSIPRTGVVRGPG